MQDFRIPMPARSTFKFSQGPSVVYGYSLRFPALIYFFLSTMAHSQYNASGTNQEIMFSRQASVINSSTATYSLYGLLPSEANDGQSVATATRQRSRTVPHSMDITLQLLAWVGIRLVR